MTNPPPPHTSVETWERGQRRREEIIEATSELFRRDGYRGTGLAAIAAAVGVTQPTVLHHFGNKEGLLRAVVARLDASGGGFGGWPEDETLTIADLIAGLASQMQVIRDQAHLRLVLVAENLMAEDPEHESFVALYGETRRRLVERLLAAQRDGRLRAGVDVDVAATEIVAVVDGIQQQWIRQPQAIDLGRALDEFAAMLEHQLYA